MNLTSERLYFRTLSKADASAAYVGWLNDPFVNQYLETRHSVQSVDSCIAFIEEMNLSVTNYLFGIFLLGSDRHIGNIKLGPVNTHHKTAQISLFLGEKSVWGNGYATEAIKAISLLGFEQFAICKIEAGCYEDNLGSLRAFIKAGYSVEGFFRQHVISEGKRKGCFHLGIVNSELTRV